MLSITNTDIDVLSFVMLSWHFPVLFGMRYIMIRSMVPDISSFLTKVMIQFQHATAENIHYFIRSYQMAIDLSINILHTYMPHFVDNEHSSFIFVISVTMLDVAVVWIGQMSSICNYYVTFDPINAGHSKHDNRNPKYGILMHTILISHTIKFHMGV